MLSVGCGASRSCFFDPRISNKKVQHGNPLEFQPEIAPFHIFWPHDGAKLSLFSGSPPKATSGTTLQRKVELLLS